jgi:hypothetical protein
LKALWVVSRKGTFELKEVRDSQVAKIELKHRRLTVL